MKTGYSIPARFLLIGLVFAVAGGAPPLYAQTEADSTAADEPSGVSEAVELMSSLETALDSILVIESRMGGKDEENRQILRVQGRKYIEVISEARPRLLELLPVIQETGDAAEDIKRRFRRFLMETAAIQDRTLAFWTQEIDGLREQRGSAPPGELGEIEQRIEDARKRLDRILSGQVTTLIVADSLGLDTGQAWKQTEAVLKNRAETLVGRLQIAVKRRDQVRDKVRAAERARASQAEIGQNRVLLQSAEQRIKGVAASLEVTVDLLGRRGYDTAPYRKFIIETTGEITEKVLDPRVLYGLIQDFFVRLWQIFRDNAPAFVIKLLILLAFVLVFRLFFRLGWWGVRLSGGAKMSRLMRDMVGRLLKSLATLSGLIAGLWFLGVNPTTLLAGVGVAGIIVGLALQDSLSNLAAGFFILTTRPYDVDDIVNAGGVLGTVKAMGLANTTVVTFDNRRLLVPNRKIWGNVIENRSAELIRRVEIEVRIAYSEDIDRAIAILHDLLKKNERVLDEPEPPIFVSELDDSWIKIAVRPWTRNADWWPLLTELPRLVRIRFAEEGIDIPFPQAEITMRHKPGTKTGRPDGETPAVD